MARCSLGARSLGRNTGGMEMDPRPLETLIHSEAATLQDNLNWIKETEARLRADGRLTPPERKKLDRMLDRNSDMIRHKKNNPARRLY